DPGVTWGIRSGWRVPTTSGSRRPTRPAARCTSPSQRRPRRRSTPSTRRRWRPAAGTTEPPALGRSTGRGTTAPSPSIPTATTSRPYSTPSGSALPDAKKTLLFLHVPKAGGTALSGALGNRLAADEYLSIYYDDDPPDEELNHRRYVTGHVSMSILD